MADTQLAGEATADGFPDVEKRAPEQQFEVEADSSAFEALERDFQEVLQELLGDESLERFRVEYEKLHRALKRSHEQEKRLVKKARELNSEILTNQARVKSALKLSAEDQKTISTLQKQLDETYKNLYSSQEKEVRSKETIKQLKEEMSSLTKLVERGAGLSVNQENMVKELRQENEELERQVNEQTSRIATIELQLRELHRQREDLKKDKEQSVVVLEDLKNQLSQKEAEVTRETRRRERTQKELQDTRVQLEEHTRKEEDMTNRIQTGTAQVQTLEAQLTETQTTMQKYLRDYDHLFNRAQKLTEDLEEQLRRNRNLQTENNDLEKVVKLKHAEVSRVHTEKDVLERKVERERRTAQNYKHQLEESRTPLLQAQAEIEALQKELQDFRRQKDQTRGEIESLERDKNVQMRATAQAEQRTKEREETIRDTQRNVGSLEVEIQHHKEEIGGLRKMIFQLEKQRERLSNEGSDWRHQYLQSLDELKLKDIFISDLQKKLTEWEGKHKQQQQMYETVRADRNVYSKNLIDAQDELAEMKKKFKILNHQIEQLKEEISTKDQALVKEHFDREQIGKLREQLQSELSRKSQLLNKNKVLLEQQANEIEKLTSFIQRVDDEALTQRKEYDQVVNERDILGTQLIRRNDELALLYEKLRIQQSALRQGEAQYAARLQDMRMMKIKLRDYERDLRMVKSNSGQVEDLTRQVLVLNRELLQEKTRVTVLSEEIERPMNVHRWRKLEGSDPATFEMIQKIQTLQRRLIAKTEEVVEKDLIIQEREKQRNELQAALDRHPGPEMAEQLSVYQSSLRDKVRQLKAMASELNMYQAQVNEYKYEIERLNRELRDTRKKYFTQRRREQIAKEISFKLNTKSSPEQLQAQQQELAKLANPRYAGGGYVIK